MMIKSIKSITFDKGSYMIFYYKYKDFLFPIAGIIVSLIILLMLIVPQIQDLLSLKEEEKITKEKISAINSNISYLSSLNEKELNQDTKIITSFLPIENDFAGILNAVTKASSNAGVTVEDYSFRVGEISTKSAQMSKEPSVQLVLKVGGGVEGCKKFLSEISKSMPVSEVTALQISGGTSSVTLAFYFRPFTQTKINPAQKIMPLSVQEDELFKKLSSWYRPTQDIIEFIPNKTGTASAENVKISNESPF